MGIKDNITTSAMVTKTSCYPDNEDSRRMQKLIGKKLTAVVVDKQGLRIRFDPHGEITIKPILDVNCSVRQEVT